MKPMHSIRLLSKQWDKLLFFACLSIILAALFFGIGFYVAEFHSGPYYKIYSISKAVCEKYGLRMAQLIYKKKDRKYPFVWFPTIESTSGVTIYRQNKTYDGATLFTDCTSSAYLIDMRGKILHKWHKPFYEVWPNPKHIAPYLPPPCNSMIYWRKARLFPNGDLLAIYEGAFAPNGAGLIKIDKNSKLIWKATVNAHHDLDIDNDGNIFVLTHRYNTSGNPRIDDFLTILSPQGEVLRNISLYDAIAKSPFKALLPKDCYDDYLHTNNVDILTQEMAIYYPFLKPGDILLSHLNINAITILDAVTLKVKWAVSGIARGIHDADFTGNGCITFFNNTWPDSTDTIGSSIITWDCINQRPKWTFTPFDFFKSYDKDIRKPDIFFSLLRGSQQLLPNGNYLVTESDGGTLYEITPQKEIVWKYVTSKLDAGSIGILCQAHRYSLNQLPFLNHQNNR